MSTAAIKSPPINATSSIKEYTLEEYLQREEKALHKHEFYNGQIIRMAGAKARHNEIAMNLGSAIKIAIRPLPIKYRVYNSDQKIYIESENLSVYPDALVVSEAPQFWEGKEELIVNPLLIVEIASKSTASYDRTRKFDFYRHIPTFKEYVLVKQMTPSVESWFRTNPDTWHIVTEKNLSASIFLRSLGVSISLTDIYENITFNEKTKLRY
jgi:Uma2 family endonuclease